MRLPPCLQAMLKLASSSHRVCTRPHACCPVPAQAALEDVEDLEADARPEDLMMSYVSGEKGKVGTAAAAMQGYASAALFCQVFTVPGSNRHCSEALGI